MGVVTYCAGVDSLRSKVRPIPDIGVHIVVRPVYQTRRSENNREVDQGKMIRGKCKLHRCLLSVSGENNGTRHRKELHV